MLLQQTLIGASDDGFNEAPIHESGKYKLTIMTVRGYYSASMRPRFMNRGSRLEERRKD